MHAKVSGLEFYIGLNKKDNKLTKELFGEHISSFELEFSEGISACYTGYLKLYGDKEASCDMLDAQIGKALCITASLDDELSVKDNKLAISNYTFKRYINAVIVSIYCEGKVFSINHDSTNYDIYEYQIFFSSPADKLVSFSVATDKYTDVYSGRLEDKLLYIFKYPSRIISGNEQSEDELILDSQLLNYEALSKQLPDDVRMQFVAVPPMTIVNRLLLGYGLNYNVVHTSDNKPKLYLSSGYGVNKGRSVESSYFEDGYADLVNYDEKAEVLCDEKDSGTPMLTKITYTAMNKKESVDKYANCLDNLLIFAAKDGKSASARETQSKADSLKYIQGKIIRERRVYNIRAAHLIYTPGTVINVKGYLANNTKLIVDDVKMHMTCALDKFFGVEHSPANPSIDVAITAFEKNENNVPGTFMSFDEITQLSGVSSVNPASKEYFFPTNPVANAISSGASDVSVLEAIVCDGSGNIKGVWDNESMEPRVGSICVCDGDNTQNPTQFYALPNNYGIPLIATVTSTVPGAKSFNFPRIGDRVLLVRSGSKYYYLATAASNDSAGVDSKSVEKRDAGLSALSLLDVAGAGHRVHVWNSADPSKNVGLKGYKDIYDKKNNKTSSIKLLKNASLRELVKSGIMDGSVSSYVQKINTDVNSTQATTKYYSTFEDTIGEKYLKNVNVAEKYQKDDDHPKGYSLADRCKQIKADYEKASASYKEAVAEVDDAKAEKKYIEREILTKKDKNKSTTFDGLSDLNEDLAEIKAEIDKKSAAADEKKAVKDDCEKYMYALADKFLDDVGVPLDCESSISDVLKIDHNGNIEICSKGAITLTANKITLQSTGGTSLTGTGGIKLENSAPIKMGVRGCSFNIFPGTMSIMATPFACGAMGSFGSFVTIDSYNGIKLNSTTIKAAAKFEASISDSLGGKIGTSKGSASVRGNAVSVGANTVHDYFMTLLRFDSQLVTELIKTIVAVSNKDEYMNARNSLDGVIYPIFDKYLSYIGTKGSDGKLDGKFQKFIDKADDYEKEKQKVIDKYKADNQDKNNGAGPTEEEIKKANLNVDAKTKYTFVATTCDYLCDIVDLLVDIVSMLQQTLLVAARLSKRKDPLDPINWLDSTGLVGKNHAEDLKYLGCSVKYALNTIAAHAMYHATKGAAALVKPPSLALGSGETTLKTYKLQVVTLGQTDANSAAMGIPPASAVTLGIDEVTDPTGVVTHKVNFNAVPK